MMSSNKTEKPIEHIHASDIRIFVKRTSARTLHPGLEAIRHEFFPHRDPYEFHYRYSRLLAVDARIMSEGSDSADRGAEAYWIRENGDPIAVLLLHFYSWATIASQICFRAHKNEDGIVETLSLAKFEDLVDPESEPQLVGEIAYLWVTPQFRQHGFGTQMFSKALDIFAESLRKGDFAFMAIRSAYSTEIVQAIFNYLLANEEEVNGRDPETGQVCITGVLVDTGQLSKVVGVDCSNFPIHSASAATKRYAVKSGMIFQGYLRTTAALYGKVWCY